MTRNSLPPSLHVQERELLRGFKDCCQRTAHGLAQEKKKDKRPHLVLRTIPWSTQSEELEKSLRSCAESHFQRFLGKTSSYIAQKFQFCRNTLFLCAAELLGLNYISAVTSQKACFFFPTGYLLLQGIQTTNCIFCTTTVNVVWKLCESSKQMYANI